MRRSFRGCPPSCEIRTYPGRSGPTRGIRPAGQGIAEPEATLEDAERAVDPVVEDRNGAQDDDTRCYFALPADDDVKDVEDQLRCAPSSTF